MGCSRSVRRDITCYRVNERKRSSQRAVDRARHLWTLYCHSSIAILDSRDPSPATKTGADDERFWITASQNQLTPSNPSDPTTSGPADAALHFTTSHAVVWQDNLRHGPRSRQPSPPWRRAAAAREVRRAIKLREEEGTPRRRCCCPACRRRRHRHRITMPPRPQRRRQCQCQCQ